MATIGRNRQSVCRSLVLHFGDDASQAFQELGEDVDEGAFAEHLDCQEVFDIGGQEVLDGEDAEILFEHIAIPHVDPGVGERHGEKLIHGVVPYTLAPFSRAMNRL